MVSFRNLRASAAFLLIALLAAAPAVARSVPVSSAVVPEPNNLVLLGLGVVGLILGRRAARHRRD